jgi:Uma2 family endonuclease
MGTPIPEHQRLIRKLLLQLETLIPDGELFLSPLDVVLDDENIPQPDLMWVAANSGCQIGDKRLYGAPDLIVEVFSPGTAHYDKSIKFRLYEKFGVRTYWMVDPTEKYVEVWQLVEGKFVQQGVLGVDETFASAVLGDKIVKITPIFS